jgi:hypothetical protein
MAEAAVRYLRDGRLDGEHAPALAVEGSLQCCPLAGAAMLHVAAALASQAAAGKAQARFCQTLRLLVRRLRVDWLMICIGLVVNSWWRRGLVVVAFDRSPEAYLEFMRRRGLDANALNRWYDPTKPFLR